MEEIFSDGWKTVWQRWPKNYCHGLCVGPIFAGRRMQDEPDLAYLKSLGYDLSNAWLVSDRWNKRSGYLTNHLLALRKEFSRSRAYRRPSLEPTGDRYCHPACEKGSNRKSQWSDRLGDTETRHRKMVLRLLPVEAADRCWLHFTLAAHRQFHSTTLEECINFRMTAATRQANVTRRIANIRRNRQRQTSGRLADQARGEMVGNPQLRKVIDGAKDPADSEVGDVRRNSSPNGEFLAIDRSELVSNMNVSVNQRSAMDDQLSRPQFNGSEPFHSSGGSDIPMQWLEILGEAKRSGFK